MAKNQWKMEKKEFSTFFYTIEKEKFEFFSSLYVICYSVGKKFMAFNYSVKSVC